jgi:hypothetical protein
MKIFYIGTGEHFDVIEHFTDCNEFVFIDSKPINDYGYDYYYRFYYKTTFVNDITNKLNTLGFNLVDIKTLTKNFTEIHKPYLESTLMIFTNQHRKIKYYISTSIPLHLYVDELLNDIKTCDTLLVSGHHPSYQIVQYLPNEITFIGYSDTWYPNPYKNDKDSYTSMEAIINNEINIKEFILVNYNTGVKQNFTNYKEFYNHYKN